MTTPMRARRRRMTTTTPRASGCGRRISRMDRASGCGRSPPSRLQRRATRKRRMRMQGGMRICGRVKNSGRAMSKPYLLYFLVPLPLYLLYFLAYFMYRESEEQWGLNEYAACHAGGETIWPRARLLFFIFCCVWCGQIVFLGCRAASVKRSLEIKAPAGSKFFQHSVRSYYISLLITRCHLV
eukprot:15488_5